jgi:hypothetical protein
MTALRRERSHDGDPRAEFKQIVRRQRIAWAHLRIDHGRHNAKSQCSGRLTVNGRVLKMPDPSPGFCKVGFYDPSHLDRHCRKFSGFSPKSAMKAVLDVGSSL